jgi:hypothetical protein
VCGGRSSSISNWMDCGQYAGKCAASCWWRVGNTRQINCSAQFRLLVRSGRRSCLHWCRLPHRFRTKRQLWTYRGFGIETHDSGEYRYVAGQLERSKKPQQVRGLNRNYNHDLKNLFKSAATNAVTKSGPLQEFYLALVKRGIRPEMARLTVARKIAAITLAIWKKGASTPNF